MTSVNRASRTVRSDLVMVVAAEVALVVALHWAGTNLDAVPLHSLGAWFRATDPTVVLVALARLAGLAIAYWLLATTVLYAAAYHLGPASLAQALHWVTLPVVRRVVQGVTAMSLTGASLLGPGALSAVPALAQPVAAVQGDTSTTVGDGEQIDTGPYAPDAAGWPSASASTDFWLGGSATAAAPVAGLQDGSEPYGVVKDDNFWTIAEDHLKAVLRRDVTEDEVAHYWVKVVDANRKTIRSGDPDLIYPQERITLPPVFGG